LTRLILLPAILKTSEPYRRFILKGLAGLFLSVFLLLPAGTQIYINGFGASNTFTIEDPDYEESADWVEIYNAGVQSVNLKGVLPDG
jgi:hypothetical protein